MIDKATQTLRQFFDDVFDSEQLATSSPKNRKHYTHSLDRFDRFLERPARLDDLTEETLAKFMRWLSSAPTLRAGHYEPSSAAETRRALQAIRAYHAEHGKALPNGGLPPTGEAPNRRPDMTVSEYLRNCYCADRLLQPRSVDQYQHAVNSISDWLGEPIRVCDLSRDLVNRWIRHMLAGALAPATVHNRRRHLLTLWIACHRDDLVDFKSGDTLHAPVAWQPPVAWTYEQVRQLLDTADNAIDSYPAYRWLGRSSERMLRATFWGLMIRIAWDTGLRSCDIFALKPQALGTDGTIELLQSKTGRWHLTKVHEETRDRILASFPPKRSKRATIIPWKMTKEHFRGEFSSLVQAAGLVGTFKTLRKSSATEVELHYPGCGGAHLGHVQPGDIARTNYLDPKLLMKNKPMPRPLRTTATVKGGAA